MAAPIRVIAKSLHLRPHGYDSSPTCYRRATHVRQGLQFRHSRSGLEVSLEIWDFCYQGCEKTPGSSFVL